MRMRLLNLGPHSWQLNRHNPTISTRRRSTHLNAGTRAAGASSATGTVSLVACKKLSAIKINRPEYSVVRKGGLCRDGLVPVIF